MKRRGGERPTPCLPPLRCVVKSAHSPAGAEREGGWGWGGRGGVEVWGEMKVNQRGESGGWLGGWV